MLGGRGGGILLGGLHDEEAGVGAEWYAFGFEGEDDAAAEFAEDGIFLIRLDPEIDWVEDGSAIDLVYTKDGWVGDDDVFELRVVADGRGDFAEQSDDLVGIGGGVDGDGERGDGKVPREIGDGGDLGVRNDVEGAVAVTDAGETKGKVFDRALEARDLDDIADVVLVFDEDEVSVNDVLEEGLGGEADAYADDAGGGEERAVVDGEEREDLEEDEEAHDAEGGGANDGGDGAELGATLGVGRDMTLGQTLEAVNEEESDAGEQKEEEQDEEELGEAFDDGEKVFVPVALDGFYGRFLGDRDEKAEQGGAEGRGNDDLGGQVDQRRLTFLFERC